MPSLTSEEFLDYLKRSELLDVEEYESTLAEIRQSTPDALLESDKLASEFLKRNLLTSWHVRQLMKRKYKGFYLRQYRILGHLGSGGMSSVYLAEHTVMKRRVAIKVLPRRRLNPAYLDRFAREAQAIAALDSQHVVRAYDVDRFEDVHYIVMEYFEGQNLRQLVEKEGPLACEDAANYIRQAALGLADAHKTGIVHRDVKPENIVVDDRDFVKVLDLGLALLDEHSFTMKDSGVDEDKILGTADYLAPEQALDSHHVDARADIYGLGATLYFCLTGKPPFPEGTISERLLAHQRKEPASIFNERPDAPVDLVEICSKMMAKKPENRLQSAEQVADVMKIWLIHNGFAQPSDFATDTNTTVEIDEFEQLISHSNVEQQFLANNEKATEIGFERNSSGFMISSSELASISQNRHENAIDLFDPAENGSASKISKSSFVSGRSSSIPDNLVLSQKSDLDASLDPLELALSEIADTTKSTLQREDSTGSEAQQTPTDVARHGSSHTRKPSFQGIVSPTHTGASPSPVPDHSTSQNVTSRTLNTNEVSSRTTHSTKTHDEDESSTQHVKSFSDWCKEAPVWFWTVALGGYAVAIFLAGVLMALLLSMK